MDEDTVKKLISEAHICPLSQDDIEAAHLLGGFLKRFRNALGNFMMLVIFVLVFAAVGAILWLVTAGHINLFKAIGL